MSSLEKKVGYLQGLFQGFNFDESTPEAKMFKAIIDVIDDLALTSEDLEDSLALLSEQVDAVDEDLDELENEFYGDDDYDDDYDDDDDCYEITCPSCGEVICVDGEIIEEGQVNCPNCDTLLEFDFDGCDCGCDDCDNCDE